MKYWDVYEPELWLLFWDTTDWLKSRTGRSFVLVALEFHAHRKETKREQISDVCSEGFFFSLPSFCF